MKEGELTIIITKIVDGGELSHWNAEVLFNEETISEITGPSFDIVVDEAINYATDSDGTIDPDWFDSE